MTRGQAITITVTAAAVSTFMLAGCAGSPAVKLPPRATTPAAPSASAPASTAAAGTPRQQVIAAEEAFWPASDRAEQSFSATKARAILAPRVTAAYLKFMMAGLRGPWAKHERATGRNIEHVTKVTIMGRAAFVTDCQDSSQHALARANGHIIASTRGPRRADLLVYLVKPGGTWLVSKVSYQGSSCAR